MVPIVFPLPDLLVTLTGVFEILGAIGLLLPTAARFATLALAVQLIAIFPANVRAAREGVTLAGRAPTPLAARTVTQIVFLIAAMTITFRDGEWGRSDTRKMCR